MKMVKMSKTTWVAIAVIVVAAVGIGIYITETDAGDNISDWIEDNMQMNGNWKQDVLITYDNGKIESLSDGSESLSVQHEGTKVESVTWVLQARASTPVGADAWQNVEIDLSQLNAASTYYNVSDILWTDSGSAGTSVSGPVDGTWFNVLSKSVDFATVADDSWSGGNLFKFLTTGSVQFRGTDVGAQGAWKSVANPPGAEFTLYYVDHDLILDWGNDVDWDNVTDTSGLPKTGDMNNDSNVNIADLTYLSNYINGTPGYETLYADGDVDCSGTIDADDVTYLGGYINGNPAYDPLYPTCGGNGGTTGVYLSVADVTTTANGAFDLDVYVHNAVDVGSCDFSIKFSNGDFAYDSIVSDGMSCAASTSVDGSYLVVSVVAYTMGSINGDSRLCTINVNAQNAPVGTYAALISDSLLLDISPTPIVIPHATTDGTITVV